MSATVETDGDVDAFTGKCREPPIGRHASHLHDMVDDRSVAIGDGLDSAVYVRRKATVQQDLTQTICFTQFRCGEIDERNSTAFFSL